MLNPENEARINIDYQLKQCGWSIQDYRQINLSAGLGIAVREYPTDSGEADYLLFIENKPVGVIEAKKEGTILTSVHEQSYRYATAKIKVSKIFLMIFFTYFSILKVIILRNQNK